jgi:hypothetical protein
MTRVAGVAGEIVGMGGESRTCAREPVPGPVGDDTDAIEIILLLLLGLGLAVAVPHHHPPLLLLLLFPLPDIPENLMKKAT